MVKTIQHTEAFIYNSPWSEERSTPAVSAFSTSCIWLCLDSIRPILQICKHLCGNGCKPIYNCVISIKKGCIQSNIVYLHSNYKGPSTVPCGTSLWIKWTSEETLFGNHPTAVRYSAKMSWYTVSKVLEKSIKPEGQPCFLVKASVVSIMAIKATVVGLRFLGNGYIVISGPVFFHFSSGTLAWIDSIIGA